MILKLLVNILEIILFAYFGIAALYVFIFSLAGLFPYKNNHHRSSRNRRIAVLIPGFKEDRVIVDVAGEACKQNYPKASYEVVVIADSFLPDTVAELKSLPIRVLEVKFDHSTKSKSLNAAMDSLGDDFDIALILDADNLMEPDFLHKISAAFDEGFSAVQGHRVAKNLNTSMAILDAISEEINNHIFRKGHRVLGLSSALIGSGMAFEYRFFKEIMKEVDAVGGFDKELELRMLTLGERIEYISDAIVFDEKVQKKEAFANQRRRWLSAQFIYFRRYVKTGVVEFFRRGNVDLLDKVYQMVQPPRILLIGLVTVITLLMGLFSVIDYIWSWETFVFSFSNWLLVWILVLLALLMATPRKFYNLATLKAILQLPVSFWIMFRSLFRLKGANKKFIHTEHGMNHNKPSK